MLLTKLLEAAKLRSAGLQDHPVPQNAPVSKDSVGKTETKKEHSSAAFAALQQGVPMHNTNSARLSFLSMWFTNLLLSYKSVTSPIVHTAASHIKTPNLKYYIHLMLYSKFIL